MAPERATTKAPHEPRHLPSAEDRVNADRAGAAISVRDRCRFRDFAQA